MIGNVFFPLSIFHNKHTNHWNVFHMELWNVDGFYFLNLKCKYATNRFIIKNCFFLAWTFSVCSVFFSKCVRSSAILLILISLKRTKSCYFVLRNDKLTRQIVYWTRFMIFDAAFYGNASFSAQFMSDLVWYRDSFWRTLNFWRIPYKWWIFDCVSHVCFQANKIAYPSGCYSKIWMLHQINVSTQILP